MKLLVMITTLVLLAGCSTGEFPNDYAGEAFFEDPFLLYDDRPTVGTVSYTDTLGNVVVADFNGNVVY